MLKTHYLLAFLTLEWQRIMKGSFYCALITSFSNVKLPRIPHKGSQLNPESSNSKLFFIVFNIIWIENELESFQVKKLTFIFISNWFRLTFELVSHESHHYKVIYADNTSSVILLLRLYRVCDLCEKNFP
jgi:hypothetical protein